MKTFDSVESACQHLGMSVPALKKLGSRYFLVSKKLPIGSIYSETYYGEQSAQGFIPSLFFLEQLTPHLGKVVLDSQTAQLFICGRDVLGESYVSQLPLESFGLLYNQQGILLGLGYKTKRGSSVIIENIFDIGYMLRREMTKKHPSDDLVDSSDDYSY
jgi:ribosome biogenesis protein Nip4